MSQEVKTDVVKPIVLDFAEYTKRKKEAIDSAHDSAIEYAEAARNSAYTSAANARADAEALAGENLSAQQAAVEAAYRRAQTGYGRQAESLARAGLTGSGYSDNLVRDAYATRASGNMAAQQAYGDAMLAAQQTENAAKAKAAAEFDLAKYTADAAKLKAETDLDAEMYMKGEEESGSKAAFDALVARTDEGAAAEAERLVGLGILSPEERDSAKTQWNTNIPTDDAAFTDGNGAYLSKKQAEDALDAYRSNAWKDETKLKELEATYAKLYTPKTVAGIEYNGDRDLSSEGRNFSIDYDGTTYYLQSAGEVTKGNVVSVAQDLEDGTVFALGGELYVKKNVDGESHVYAIEKRGWANGKTNSYTLLLAKLKASGQTKREETKSEETVNEEETKFPDEVGEL